MLMCSKCIEAAHINTIAPEVVGDCEACGAHAICRNVTYLQKYSESTFDAGPKTTILDELWQWEVDKEIAGILTIGTDEYYLYEMFGFQFTKEEFPKVLANGRVYYAKKKPRKYVISETNS